MKAESEPGFKERPLFLQDFRIQRMLLVALGLLRHLTVYEDRLVILLPLQGEHVLELKDIDSIERKLFTIQIHHHSGELKAYVYIKGMGTGWLLFKKLEKAIKDNHLPIQIIR